MLRAVDLYTDSLTLLDKYDHKGRSKATGGAGLGLAIVKHIVEIHDAKIELDSAPEVGTTISVMF